MTRAIPHLDKYSKRITRSIKTNVCNIPGNTIHNGRAATAKSPSVVSDSVQIA